MRLIHLSDLHFGTVLPDMTPLLLNEIERLNPALVIISGDFTQTAIAEEFEEARKFLASLRFPYLAIPGNHDVPRYDLKERFLDPYKKYRRFISPVLEPVYRDDLACIAGINTARRVVPHWNWAHGAISTGQTGWLKKQYDSGPQDAFRICVMHHPVWKVTEAQLRVIVFGGHKALQALKDSKVDLVLSGHVHHAAVHTMPVDDHNKIIFLSASTALSRRLRGQKNGFNVIDLHEKGRMTIEIRGYVDGRFEKLESYEHMSR